MVTIRLTAYKTVGGGNRRFVKVKKPLKRLTWSVWQRARRIGPLWVGFGMPFSDDDCMFLAH